MNQSYNSGMNPSYIPSQSTYPPYTNFVTTQTTPVNQGISSNPVQNPQYAESIFAKNRGKRVSAYFSYPDSVEWRDKVFTGVILDDGRDYLLLQDDQGKTILLWLVYINYAIFEETPNY